ncbi:prickle-like protein 4 isoform X2 [Erinaceus europaeus]|uniref:Prickle-like protein 4 isoform X2 n=1 Tax=Erinaceus europaeus TaxID=9365 RepID=A0ABM3XAF0_ERIEU|nr:prickle-like protein 4 isoform X2 [Erinaceus europaeus]
MSVLKSCWPHGGERFIPWLPDPPAISDSGAGHLPEADSEDISAQEPYCLVLGEEELAELRLFCAQRRQEALGQGLIHVVPPKHQHTCEKCREPLKPGEHGVFAAHAGKQRCWHLACFACQACGQALISLIYFYHDGHLYCSRHHAELLRPRCPACDQLIFSPRCTEAEGRCWHENHFCCQDCAGPLGGGRYALPGGGPCCPSCFESRYSDAASSPDLTAAGRASLAPPLSPQTRAWGPAALTARPWLERSEGLPSPPSAAVRAAAPDGFLGWGQWRRGSAETQKGTAPSGAPRPAPPHRYFPLLPAPTRRARGGCLDPARSRSVQPGIRPSHPKSSSRTP